jgi:N-carbamoyl-L-amino-acid hydrolase
MTLVSPINAGRLWARLMALAAIGATPAGGVNRQSLSDGEIAAWRRVIGWAREAGLTAASDAAGNLFLTLAGRDRSTPPFSSAVISTPSRPAESSMARPVSWRRLRCDLAR